MGICQLDTPILPSSFAGQAPEKIGPIEKPVDSSMEWRKHQRTHTAGMSSPHLLRKEGSFLRAVFFR